MPQLKYELDTTGQSPANASPPEIHEITNRRQKVLVPAYGAYYYRSLKVRNVNTNQILDPDVDYYACGYHSIPSSRLGRDIRSLIYIESAQVGDVYEIQYQILGGEYSYSKELLNQLYQDIPADTDRIDFYDLINRPARYTPAPHLTDARDIYGLEYIIDAIGNLEHAILTGDLKSHEEIYGFIDRETQRVRDAINQAFAEHSASDDHDYRYFTRDEMDAKFLQASKNITTGLHGPTTIYHGETNRWWITDYDSFAVYTVESSHGSIVLDREYIELTIPITEPVDPGAEVSFTIVKNNVVRKVVLEFITSSVTDPLLYITKDKFHDTTLDIDLEVSAFSTRPAGIDGRLRTELEVSDTPDFSNILTTKTDTNVEFVLRPSDITLESSVARTSALNLSTDPKGVFGLDNRVVVVTPIAGGLNLNIINPLNGATETKTIRVAGITATGYCRSTILNDDLYVTVDTSTTKTQVLRINLKSFTLLSITQPNLTRITEHAMVAYHDSVYLYGGLVGGVASDTVYVYNTSLGQWSLSRTTNPAIRNSRAVVAQGQLYFIGGQTTTGTWTQDIWAFDPDSSIWHKTDTSVGGLLGNLNTATALSDGFNIIVLKATASQLTTIKYNLFSHGFTSDSIAFDNTANKLVHGVITDSGLVLVNEHDSKVKLYTTSMGILPIVYGTEDEGPGLGAQQPEGKNTVVKYYGTVTSAELGGVRRIAELLGITQGTEINAQTRWLKVRRGNDVYLVAEKPIRRGVSWKHLYDKGVVYRDSADDPTTTGRVSQDTHIRVNGFYYSPELLSATSDDFDFNGWVTGTHTYGGGISDLSAQAPDGKVWYIKPSTNQTTVYVYDCNTGTSTTHGTIAKGLVDPIVEIKSGGLYIYEPAAVGNKLSRYDLTSGQYVEFNQVNDLPPRSDTTITTYDGRIHVVGGRQGSTVLNTVSYYDEFYNNWLLLAEIPVPVYGHRVTIDGDTLYVFGGVQANGQPHDKIQVVDLITGDTKLLSTEPLQYIHGGLVVRDHQVVMFGGRITATGGGVRQTYVFDYQTQQLHKFDLPTRFPQPTARTQPTMVVVDGHIKLLGGRGTGNITDTWDLWIGEFSYNESRLNPKEFVGSEWNDIMYSMGVADKGNGLKTQTFGQLRSLSDDQLGLGGVAGSNNHTKTTNVLLPNEVITRGGLSVNTGSSYSKTSAVTALGWRPVLRLLGTNLNLVSDDGSTDNPVKFDLTLNRDQDYYIRARHISHGGVATEWAEIEVSTSLRTKELVQDSRMTSVGRITIEPGTRYTDYPTYRLTDIMRDVVVDGCVTYGVTKWNSSRMTKVSKYTSRCITANYTIASPGYGAWRTGPRNPIMTGAVNTPAVAYTKDEALRRCQSQRMSQQMLVDTNTANTSYDYTWYVGPCQFWKSYIAVGITKIFQYNLVRFSYYRGKKVTLCQKWSSRSWITNIQTVFTSYSKVTCQKMTEMVTSIPSGDFKQTQIGTEPRITDILVTRGVLTKEPKVTQRPLPLFGLTRVGNKYNETIRYTTEPVERITNYVKDAIVFTDKITSFYTYKIM